MNEFLRTFVTDTKTEFSGRLRTPPELFQRQASADELNDLAVLSGYSIADILSGKVAETDLDPQVLHAFHLQYPNAGGFIELVHSHEGDALALNGIVQAVKGKLFEVEYVNWLNDGHLPDGATAELASSPTQEGWDIEIRDSHHHVIDHLQLKATESLSYIKEALAAHPEIDVITTHEVFQHLDGSGLEDHVTASDISNNDLTQHLREQVHAVDMTPEFELPLLAFGIIAVQSILQYRSGKVSAIEASRRALKRGGRSLLCRGAAYISILISHEPVVGLPVSILTRTTFSRFDVHERFISLIDQYCAEMRRRLVMLSALQSN